jgi:hypothetical protein
VVTRKLVHVIISCTKTMYIYAIVQMTIIDLVALGCILWHSAAFQDNWTSVPTRHNNSASWINSQSSILISKTTTFTYEIKHLDPLTQTFLLSITSNTIFYHTLHGKYSDLQCTLHNFLHWFPILIHLFLTYSCNTNEGKQKKKTR